MFLLLRFTRPKTGLLPRSFSTSWHRYSHNTRTYAEAIQALNSLQSNHSIVNAIKKSGQGMNEQAIPEMNDWLRRAGYRAEDFKSLNAIHVAGTKGKGSTAAFVSSILNQYREDEGMVLINKVGLYTSPHLRFVRERIQINGEALSETSFATSFFEIWDRLEQSRLASPFPAHQATKPIYFRYLTIMALHTYLKEQVDAAIIECGMGGEYDSTNVLLSPAVAGITSLGIDHVQMLGSTIDKIAWHKAGIMKQGVRVFTSPQPKEAMEVLFSRVKERGASLEVVNVHPQIAAGQVELGLKGDFQRINASLAVELAAHFLRTQKYLDVNTSLLPAKFRAGLKDVRLGGRCEVRLEPHLKWYIDGAHTIESIQATSQWYSSLRAADTRTCLEDMPRILLFNQQTRDGLSLLKQLQEVVLSNTSDHPPFTHAIFCSNITYTSSGYRPDLVSINVDSNIVQGLQVQKELAKGWRDLVKASYRCQIFVVPTIEEAVKQCREIGLAWRKYRPTAEDIPSVLATGSMHLVGGLLDVLEEVSVTG